MSHKPRSRYSSPEHEWSCTVGQLLAHKVRDGGNTWVACTHCDLWDEADLPRLIFTYNPMLCLWDRHPVCKVCGRGRAIIYAARAKGDEPIPLACVNPLEMFQHHERWQRASKQPWGDGAPPSTRRFDEFSQVTGGPNFDPPRDIARRERLPIGSLHSRDFASMPTQVPLARATVDENGDVWFCCTKCPRTEKRALADLKTEFTPETGLVSVLNWVQKDCPRYQLDPWGNRHCGLRYRDLAGAKPT